MKHKTIEEQVEEFRYHFVQLLDIPASRAVEVIDDYEKALQERDRIAREEERERIVNIIYDKYYTCVPRELFADIQTYSKPE